MRLPSVYDLRPRSAGTFHNRRCNMQSCMEHVQYTCHRPLTPIAPLRSPPAPPTPPPPTVRWHCHRALPPPHRMPCAAPTCLQCISIPLIAYEISTRIATRIATHQCGVVRYLPISVAAWQPPPLLGWRVISVRSPCNHFRPRQKRPADIEWEICVSRVRAASCGVFV